MPNNWKTYKLGDIADITSSKRIFLADYVEKGIPFYRSKEIIEKANGLETSTNLFIDEKKYFGIKEKFGSPIDGDLLISAVGERAGIPYCVENDGEFYFKDGNLIWFKNFKNDIHSKFLYYYFRTDIGTNLLESTMIGSAQRALTIIGLKNIKIEFPFYKEQQSIASILSAIDDKIENNLAINKTLEEMAMALYKHWFVDFGPFQDGEFVESELGLIPKGWEVKSVYDIANYVNGAAFKPSELIDEGKYVIKISELNGGITKNTGKSIKEVKPEQIIHDGSVLFSWSATLDIFLWDKGEALLNQHIFNVLPNKTLSKEILYFLLKNIIAHFKAIAADRATTMGHIKITHLKETLIAIPDKEIQIEIDGLLKPLFNQILENLTENQTLTQLRDTLLPKLISGEVRLKEFRESE